MAETDLEALLREYGGMMEYIVRTILPEPQEAEDCLAEVRARLVEKLDTYRPEKAKLSTWLTALCRNAAFDRRRALDRAARRTGSLEEDLPDAAPGPEETLLRRERAEELDRALATLRERDLRLFYRKYYYLQSTQRIAAELGLTERAVEGRLYRIRRRLQAQLGGEEA